MRFLLLFFVLSQQLFAADCDPFITLHPADSTNTATTNNHSEVVTPDYPLSVILKNLRIHDDLIREWARQNIKVLSIGEEHSPLLPYLLHHEVKAIEHLVSGSTLHIPLQDNSVKVVITHMLLSNLKNQEAKNQAIGEILRVLEPGGVALIADFSGYIYQKAEREFAEAHGAYTIEADVNLIDWQDLKNAEVKRRAFRFFAFQKNSERLRQFP